MNLVSLDDMTAIIFGLGVARIDSNWELSIGLIAGAIIIRFAKAWFNHEPVAGKR
jgi:hypothetical protein